MHYSSRINIEHGFPEQGKFKYNIICCTTRTLNNKANITLTAEYTSNPGCPTSPFWPFSPGRP